MSFGNKLFMREQTLSNQLESAKLIKTQSQSDKLQNEAPDVQFIEFETYGQLKKFLRSYFQLKPMLLTSTSFNKFRIVIENYVDEDMLEGASSEASAF